MNYYNQFIPGHFTFAQFYTDLVERLNFESHIVEVGCFLGCSSSYLGTEIYNSKKNIRLDCIDLFDKDKFNQFKENPGLTYMTFVTDLLPLIGKINLHILQLDSITASTLYPDNSLDFVFIDADHEYDSVLKDITAWYPKIKGTGTLAGHDWMNGFPGVDSAVSDYFMNKETVNVSLNEYVWWIDKNVQVPTNENSIPTNIKYSDNNQVACFEAIQ